MDFQDTLEQLNIVLGDSGDVTFTPEEKTRALTKAWNDPYVVRPVSNSTLTYSTSSSTQAIPSGITTVRSLGFSASNSANDFPEGIDNVWYQDGANIVFNPGASRYITNGYTLYLRGNYKITVSDTLDTVALQEYVISLAGYNTLQMLGHKKVNLFLKNDTTLSELITLRRELRQDVIEGRSRLAKTWESF